jgi:hypothetical protein
MKSEPFRRLSRSNTSLLHLSNFRLAGGMIELGEKVRPWKYAAGEVSKVELLYSCPGEMQYVHRSIMTEEIRGKGRARYS